MREVYVQPKLIYLSSGWSGEGLDSLSDSTAVSLLGFLSLPVLVTTFYRTGSERNSLAATQREKKIFFFSRVRDCVPVGDFTSPPV